MLEPSTLQTARRKPPFERASENAARVSAVSPDCEMATVSTPSSAGASR